ncbi:hypothetical protein HN873_041100 [Arachis hypogaea]
MDREKAAPLSSLLGLVAGVTVVAVEGAASEGDIAVAKAHRWCNPKLPPPLLCFTARGSSELLMLHPLVSFGKTKLVLPCLAIKLLLTLSFPSLLNFKPS